MVFWKSFQVMMGSSALISVDLSLSPIRKQVCDQCYIGIYTKIFTFYDSSNNAITMEVILRPVCERDEEEKYSLILWIAQPQKMQHIDSQYPDFPLAALLMSMVTKPCALCYSFLRECLLCIYL